jgi:glycolate oxidase FAD binding subunit
MSDRLHSLQAALGRAAVTQLAEGGVPVVRADSIDLASEALRYAHGEGLRVLPAGAGTHLGAARGCDFILAATGMSRILEYEPADLVAVVESGVTLADLDARLAAHGQRVAPDPAAHGGATVGGAVAANRCGPSRRGRGTWRDVVLGARVVHADGRTSRSGGRVVKNVAGFDLAKLWIGSHGSLVWIAELALRLVPRPRAVVTRVQRLDPASAWERALALHRAALAPQAILVVRGDIVPGLADGDAGLVIRFEGHPDAVADQVRVATTVAGAWDEAAEGVWDGVHACLDPRGEAGAIRIFGLPTAGRAWLDALDAATASCVVVQFGVGIADARLRRDCDAADMAARLGACGARWMWTPGRAAGPVPAPQTPQDAVARDLARATKAALDTRSVLPARCDLVAAS